MVVAGPGLVLWPPVLPVGGGVPVTRPEGRSSASPGCSGTIPATGKREKVSVEVGEQLRCQHWEDSQESAVQQVYLAVVMPPQAGECVQVLQQGRELVHEELVEQSEAVRWL